MRHGRYTVTDPWILTFSVRKRASLSTLTLTLYLIGEVTAVTSISIENRTVLGSNKNSLDNILQLGEGQYIEFKETLDKSFAKEVIAFANASGGTIYLGITDSNKVKGISISNKLKSQIQDIAYNCDPAIILSINEISNNILAIEVNEGNN